MTARSFALSFACSLFALMGAACSSSSAGSATPAGTGDDANDTVEPSDDGSTLDGATRIDAGPGGNDDASSPRDVGDAEASAVNDLPAGEAGVTQFCAAGCVGLRRCDPDSGMACTCAAGSTALYRTDFVDALSTCLPGAIAADCADPMTASENCVVSATASIEPTAAVAAFCQNLAFTACSQGSSNCLVELSIYSDTTIAKASNCLSDIPDADIDGGCTDFGNCLTTALSP